MTDVAEAPDTFGSTIFCDDIRFEMDGKISFIGSYTGIMYIRDEFPVIIPKFGLSIQFVQSVRVYKSNLRLKVFFPGDKDDSPSMESDWTQATMPEPPPPEGRYVIVRANFILSPLNIVGPGHIKIRVEREGVLHGCGSLRIERMPAAPNAPSTASPPPA